MDEQKQGAGPRERLEHRAERAVIRIPFALLGIIFAILMQGGYIVWRDGVRSERDEATRSALSDTRKQIGQIAGKVDGLYQTRLTSRDIERVTEVLSDHESRIRYLERGRAGQ